MMLISSFLPFSTADCLAPEKANPDHDVEHRNLVHKERFSRFIGACNQLDT